MTGCTISGLGAAFAPTRGPSLLRCWSLPLGKMPARAMREGRSACQVLVVA